MPSNTRPCPPPRPSDDAACDAAGIAGIKLPWSVANSAALLQPPWEDPITPKPRNGYDQKEQ